VVQVIQHNITLIHTQEENPRGANVAKKYERSPIRINVYENQA
jgi:hypothetical protein